MALNAKNAGNGKKDRIEQPLIEPGVYPARLVQLIDLGLQAQRPYKGQDKAPVQEIMLTYELVDCFMVNEAGEEVADKPRWISETLPFYGLFADKAKSTQRYHAFDPKDAFDGDFSKAVGLPINVTLVNNIVGEKVYTNVANVAAMRPRDAAACPELQNPAKTFDLDAPDMEVYNKLPKWIQEKIQENLTFQGSVLEGVLKGKPAAPAKEAKAPKAEAPKAPPAEDDDLPY
jgi:hypothetical protein